jgi:hypothetical protein
MNRFEGHVSLTGGWASATPEVAWRYWGIYEFMDTHPGMYGMDQQRSECHTELCKKIGISKELSRKVTDHLDKYETAVDMYYALCQQKPTPKEQEEG